MDNEEAAFNALLDSNPADHTTRLVFADWLDERGDPRGPGMRALGLLRRIPCPCDEERERKPQPLPERKHFYGDRARVGRRFGDADNEYPDCLLPSDWLEALSPLCLNGGAYRWVWIRTRRGAEDAAALAFSTLSPERQAAILGGVLCDQ